MKKLVSGAISVEMPITAIDNKIFFPDVADIRGLRIKHISVYHPNLWLNTAFVTLKEMNTQNELIKSIPVHLLQFDNDPLFINKIVDLPHSFVDVSRIPAAERNGTLFFTFWFDEPKIWGKVRMKKNRTQIHPMEIKLTGAKTYFAENRDLHGKLFQNIIFSQTTFTPMGNETIDYPWNCYLTLCKDNNEFFRRIPLEYFYQRGTYDPLRLQNITFDFQKSYIETTNPENYGKSIFFNAVIDDNK